MAKARSPLPASTQEERDPSTSSRAPQPGQLRQGDDKSPATPPADGIAEELWEALLAEGYFQESARISPAPPQNRASSQERRPFVPSENPAAQQRSRRERRQPQTSPRRSATLQEDGDAEAAKESLKGRSEELQKPSSRKRERKDAARRASSRTSTEEIGRRSLLPASTQEEGRPSTSSRTPQPRQLREGADKSPATPPSEGIAKELWEALLAEGYFKESAQISPTPPQSRRKRPSSLPDTSGSL